MAAVKIKAAVTTAVRTWCSCLLRTHRGFDMNGIACWYTPSPVERLSLQKDCSEECSQDRNQD